MKYMLSWGKQAAVAAFASAGAVAAFADPMVDLSSVQYVQYGDGQSYSLPFAIEDKCGGSTTGCPYYVQSSPGQISNLVVLATGNKETNYSGMDNAYLTPSGAGGAPFFQTSAGTSDGSQGSILNNGANTWDSSLSALKGFLGGDQMVFFFNNNQLNKTDAQQSLAAWGQVWITDANNKVLGVYDFTNNQHPYALFTQGGGGTFMGDVSTYTSAGVGGPLAGDNTMTDYVLSGGGICRNAGVPVDCAQAHDEGPVNHNLGANNAAYAVLFPELTAELNALFAGLSDATLAGYTLHADVRLGCDPAVDSTLCDGSPWGRSLNNGFEQLFMGTAAQDATTCSPNDPNCNTVPEPNGLMLVGLALLASGAAAWRHRRTS